MSGGDEEARRRIAEDLDATFVVEAAAGTGKTTSLVERVLGAVGAGVDVGSIVAVTFTDKAAAELKLRIRIGLERRRAERASAIGDPYGRALEKLEHAHISTIHRFAGDLLRMRPVEAGVDPLFVALSPPESRALLDEAFGRWLERSLAQPSAAVTRILARHDASVDKLRRAAMRLVENRHLDAPWAHRDVDVASEARVLADRVRDIADRSRAARTRTDRLFVALAPVREIARRAPRLSGPQLEADLVELSRRSSHDSPGYGPYGEGVDRQELARDFKRLKEDLVLFESRASAHLAVDLRDDLMEVVQGYDTLKAKRGALDFDDLVLRAREVLLRDPGLRRDLGRRLSRYFVDEFQDTDPVQAGLLILLASDDEAIDDPFRARIAPGRLFVVGDPKQSIYRFRHADPGTYALVRSQVVASGGEVLELSVSFRSVPGILTLVNTAFEARMDGDAAAQQASYVPLLPSRAPIDEAPAVLGLPVPEPYGSRRLSKMKMRESYPRAMGAFIAWLLRESGRTVIDPVSRERVPIAPRHIAVLYRQFESYGKSAPEPLSKALDERRIPHVVLGSGHLGGRDEAHAITVALAAVEKPDDPLLVYATLRGLLFGMYDETLFEWIRRYGVLTATALPKTAMPQALGPVLEALLAIGELHRLRNVRPPVETLSELLRITRAIVGFALSPSAEQAFLQVAAIEQVAAAHEHGGGLSYGAFVDSLEARERDRAAIAEDVTDDEAGGVRIMTVHRAKGLEFPVVILGDPTEGAARPPDKVVDVEQRLGALSLLGCRPWDLLEANDVELARAVAEGARIAYVAATRARDLLVVPVVGDDPSFPKEGWTAPLGEVFASDPARPMQGPDVVKNRPLDVERPRRSLAAGVHEARGGRVEIVDLGRLDFQTKSSLGVGRLDLISKDVPQAVVDEDRAIYEAQTAARAQLADGAARARFTIETVTARAKGSPGTLAPSARVVRRETIPREVGRPTGKRFGTLVHLVLATVPLDAEPDVVHAVARSVARLVDARSGEPEAAARATIAALAHPVFDRARAAAGTGRAFREIPVTLDLGPEIQGGPDAIVDGVIDLAIEEGEQVAVIDYKTDDPATLLPENLASYEAQVDLYARALERTMTKRASAFLLFV